MKVEVFGVRTYTFPDEKTGVIKEGVTAHYTQKAVSDGWKGLEYGKFSVGKDSVMYGAVMSMPIPIWLDLEFNHKGRVIDFEVIENV